MTTPETLYVDGIKKRFSNYFAAWLPNEPYRLGDLGILNGNIFIRTNNVQDPSIGFTFTERADPDPSPIDVVSESGVALMFKAAGEVNTLLPNVPQGEAGIGIEFSAQGAFILKAPETYQPSIENIDKLRQDVFDAYVRGRWDKRWAVIVRLVKAPHATIIVSKSSQAKLEFIAKGDFSSGPINLGNANLTFELRAQKGDLFQSVGATNVTPLFQLARIKRRFFGQTEVEILNKFQSKGLLPIDLLTPESAKNDTALEFELITDNDPEYLRGV